MNEGGRKKWGCIHPAKKVMKKGGGEEKDPDAIFIRIGEKNKASQRLCQKTSGPALAVHSGEEKTRPFPLQRTKLMAAINAGRKKGQGTAVWPL